MDLTDGTRAMPVMFQASGIPRPVRIIPISQLDFRPPPRHFFAMTRLPALAVAALAAAVSFPRTDATIVGTGLIGQPAYLGNASQPDRIPLAPVIENSNHGYGAHTAIFQSRPCYHGHFLADGRPEYEHNLAVLLHFWQGGS
jgi:hypothetical protein